MPTKGDAPALPGARAVARHVRITPMKARRVVDLVRGMPAREALTVLKFAPQAASEAVYKVLASAIANAENNERLDPDSLLVRAAFVDEGPTLKRFRPRAQGRAYRIRKRTCHITIEVESVTAGPGGRRSATVATPGRRAAKASPARAASKAAPTKAAPATESDVDDVDDVDAIDTETVETTAPAKATKAAKATEAKAAESNPDGADKPAKKASPAKKAAKAAEETE